MFQYVKTLVATIQYVKLKREEKKSHTHIIIFNNHNTPPHINPPLDPWVVVATEIWKIVVVVPNDEDKTMSPVPKNRSQRAMLQQMKLI